MIMARHRSIYSVLLSYFPLFPLVFILLALPRANSWNGIAIVGFGGNSVRCGRSARLGGPISPRMQQGDWTTPGGDNRRDLAQISHDDVQRNGDSSARIGGDGVVGGSEIRMAPGARRMTPGERIHAMGVPMETGVVSSQKNAKGLSQKQTLQDSLSSGENWWAGESIDLHPESPLPPDWVESNVDEFRVGSGRVKMYRNIVTGALTSERPRTEAKPSQKTEWSDVASRQQYSQFHSIAKEDEQILNAALGAMYQQSSKGVQVVGKNGKGEMIEASFTETQTLMRKALDMSTDTLSRSSEAPKEKEEESPLYISNPEEADTRTLVRRIIRDQQQDDVDLSIQANILSGPTITGDAEERVLSVGNAGEEEPLLTLMTETQTLRNRKRKLIEGGGGERERVITDFLWEQASADVAPIQPINAEGQVISSLAAVNNQTPLSAESRQSAKSQRREENQVPKHLLPGSNAQQMNWAERQLAQAQQSQRPLSDLPGFAANFLKASLDGRPAAAAQDVGEEEEEEEAGEEVPPLWNPIPWKINPQVPTKPKKRKVLQTAESLAVSAAPTAPTAALKTEADKTADIFDVLFKDDLQLLDVKRAGAVDVKSGGKSSSDLISMAMTGNSIGARIDDETVTDPLARSFQFVDEHQCIGCYNCAMIARNTFLIEDTHGRARVFQQKGDSDAVIEEAILSCPVDCIHAVTFKELQQLEEEVKDDVINNKSRLVGGSYTAEEKGGTPWLRLLSRRAREGKGSFLGF